MERLYDLIKYVVLAIVQGLGEVLPISSSGHLLIIRNMLGIDTKGMSIELILHLASLLALFIYYKKTIFSLVKGNIRYIFKRNKEYTSDFKFLKGMIISLIPTCLVGYFLNDYLDYFFSYSVIVGVFLILNGINLYSIKNKENIKSISELKTSSFVKIGIGQCLGLVPGFSRSGSCLSMCYREKINKDDSEKFTFLMLFPLVTGSIILNLEDFVFNKSEIPLLVISFILTFMITLFSIKILNKIIKNNKLHYFSYYCLIVGILLIIF